MPKSEIAELKRQIELECEAMERAISGYSVVAKHRCIRQRYQRLGQYQEKLSKLVGEEQALTILCDIYDRHID